LKAGGRAGTGRGLHAYGTRAVLVTLQIALALVLLTGAGLMSKSAARLEGTEIGGQSRRSTDRAVRSPAPSYSPETVRAFQAQLVDRVRTIPGVASAGLANCPPVSGGCNGTSIWFGRPPRRTGTEPLVGIHCATPDYVPALQPYQARMRLFVRSGLDTGGLVNAIRRELRALDPNLPISEIKPMEELATS
jgi:hypothetical protein